MNHSELYFLRERFAKAYAFFAPNNYAPETSLLRVEQPLVNGQGKYTFDIIKKGPVGLTEKKLEYNDIFIASALGVYLKIEDTTKPGTGMLRTFPGQANTTGANFTNVTDIEALYNGRIQLKTGQVVTYEGIPMVHFKRVYEAQGITAGSQGEFSVNSSALFLPEQLTLCGDKTYDINIEFPSYPGSNYQATVTTMQTSLVFIVYGWLVKNGSQLPKNNLGVLNPYNQRD
jgi:hypothetical protein